MRYRTPIFVVLLSLFVWRSGRTARNILLFPKGLPHAYFAGGDADKACKPVKDTSGELRNCEDVIFWDVKKRDGTLSERRLVLSCEPERLDWNPAMAIFRSAKARGALWIYRYTQKKAVPQKLELEGFPSDAEFHPLGIDIYSPNSPSEPSQLFVINTQSKFNTIEIFNLLPDQPTRAIYKRTLHDKRFLAPNNIVATSPTSFYLTNDHLFTGHWLPWPLSAILPVAEAVLGLPLTWVSHVDFSGQEVEYTWAALGIPFANGIAALPDGKTIAVSSSSMTKILFYERTEGNPKLRFVESLEVPFAPDNLSIDDDGALIVTGVPNFPSFTAVAEGKGEHSPSWVASVTARDGRKVAEDAAPLRVLDRVPASAKYHIETLYQSDGTGYSTSTGSVVDKKNGRLFVAGIYADGVLECKS